MLIDPHGADLAEYLRDRGHEVKEVWGNDLALKVAEAFAPDAVLYREHPDPIAPHKDALKALVLAGLRVVLAARRESPLVPYAGALGVRDYVFLPADPAEALRRLENPAAPEEAAEAVWGAALKAPEREPEGPKRAARLGAALGGVAARLRRGKGPAEKAEPGGTALGEPGEAEVIFPEEAPGPGPVEAEFPEEAPPGGPAGRAAEAPAYPALAVAVGSLGGRFDAVPRAALALAEELGRRAGRCLLIDADPDAMFAAAEGVEPKGDWTEPLFYTHGGVEARFARGGGSFDQEKDARLRRLLAFRRGPAVVYVGGDWRAWPASGVLPWCDAAVWAWQPGARGVPPEAPPGLIAASPDSCRAARLAAKRTGLPALPAGKDWAARVADLLPFLVTGRPLPKIPGLVRPSPWPRRWEKIKAAGRALDLALGRAWDALAAAWGTAWRLAEAAFWIGLLAALALGAVWAAGLPFRAEDAAALKDYPVQAALAKASVWVENFVKGAVKRVF
jgi:hypothetical protein